MKIGWFSPFNVKSAIGRYSASVVKELSERGHDVHVFRTELFEARNYAPLDCGVPTLFADEVTPEYLREEFDVVFYNIGDHYLYHGAVLRFMDSAPGIGVFHDFYLYDLFLGWLHFERPSVEAHDEIVSEFYGQASCESAWRFRRGEVGLDSAAAHHPMTEWIASRCIGALAHADFYASRLRASCCGPVRSRHLTYRLTHVCKDQPGRSAGVTILTVGHVNSNKCVDKVIAAFGASPALRALARYKVVGAVDPLYRAHLEAYADSLGVRDRVEFTGEVDRADLEDALDDADIICCLRQPVLEGASASAIEGMLMGRPVIVVDDGFYSELPDGLVVKLNPRVEVSELIEKLVSLVCDPIRRVELGNLARGWAVQHFSVQNYCDAALAVAQDVISMLPVLRVSDQVAWRLAHMGISPTDPSVHCIADAMQSLFLAVEREG